MASKSAVVRVDGARQLRKELAEFTDAIEDLKKIHKEIAERAADKARARIPKRTGRLASSVRGSGTKTMASVRWGRKSVPYAGPIEFGGYPNGVPFVAKGKHVYPAVEDFGPQALALYAREIDRLASRFNV